MQSAGKMVTKDGKKVKVIEGDEPTEIDEKTGKPKPKKKKIVNEDGEIEDVEEIEVEPSEIDEETGKKKPKKKKYKTKKGDVIVQ